MSELPLIPFHHTVGMDVAATLPRIDEHEISVDARAPLAWAAAVAVFRRLSTRRAWRAYAQAVRCQPRRASGAADTVGATLPGFLVVRSEAPTEWALEGEHLFSRYALTFRIVPVDAEHCRVIACSSAEFPGPHGMAYRALVIGSRGHAIGLRRLLRSIKSEAERRRD
jgi:hypothetical protein